MWQGETVQPAVAFVMPDHTFRRAFTAAEIDRIARAGRLLRETPIETFDDPADRHVLVDAEVFVTGWGTPPIGSATLDLAPRLRAIVHAAGSVKHHVTHACWERGILVTSAADANARPVAEYTVAMILLAGKNVLQIARALHERREAFEPDALFPRMGNYGKRIGIIGASKIGRDVIQLLRPYDVQVVVSDPFLRRAEAEALGVELAELPELLATCEIVSLHAPSLPETRHLLDRAALGLLQPGATLINTARGELVDQDALVDRVHEGDIFAILDVTTPWTLPPGHPFYDAPNVLLTPHLAGSLGVELTRLADAAADEVERIADGRPPAHPVDGATLSITA
ncbi:hydroxyacid dehydrogenase [Flexivirga oryzae]|uniref:Phosphoglycerate dehydrogenase-like enzyme n=1 Tax=Flexivirga oryzae TaxID=1794944 RepID=A0A839N4D3_9MICO|nr:hydroxyacid dehydrogenase [Flexivirga oryzae]MBB2890924.1 phosphoglycerate dehydrogenase-like enzyme [Flexivirga oryzae]